MKLRRFLSLWLTGVILISTITMTNVFASVNETLPAKVTDSEENKSNANQILKSYFDVKTESKIKDNQEFIFTSLGKYKDYELCYGGYDVTQPWELWEKIGKYAFKVNIQIKDDNKSLGLYLVKDNDVLRLDTAFDNLSITDTDMNEIVKLMASNSECKKYFLVYDITDVQVADSGDYTICYEGITNNCFESADNIAMGQQSIKLGKYSIYVYGYESVIPNGAVTKGLYVIDKDNKIIDFLDAYEKSLIGSPDEIINLLNNSGYGDKGYWKITSESTPDNTIPTTVPVTKPVVKKTTISLARYSANVYVKGSTVIKSTVKNGRGKTTFKSLNTKVAKVYSNGKVIAIKAGTAKIRVTNNKISRIFTVKVLNPRLNKTSVAISRGKSFTLKITGRIGTAKFYTSNKRIATVNSKGKITVNKKAKKGQSAVITVKTNGVTLRCKVKVK